MVNNRTFRTEYGYDGRDNLTQVTYPSGRVVRYDLNAANQIPKVYQPNDGPVWKPEAGSGKREAGS